MTAVEIARSPYSGTQLREYPTSSPSDVDAAVDAAALVAPGMALIPPATLSAWLGSIADAILGRRDELVELADTETGLGLARLAGEVERAADQLRFYGSVALEGSHLGAALDTVAMPTGPSLIRRVQRPVGPVAVFGASNFPFAFGVLGHDVGSAIAAGNPVVVKGHPAHPGLSRRLAELALGALRDAGAPDGVLTLVTGFDSGARLVQHRAIRAVGFTGSEHGGLALWRLANTRSEVIPVYAEMGTVNAVVVTRGAAADPQGVANGFVDSFTLGMGQFCTKPGLLLAPRGSQLAGAVANAVVERAGGVLLTEAIATHCAAGIERLLGAGARVLAHGLPSTAGWAATATVLTAPADALIRTSPLLAEVFGPVALIVEYADSAELDAIIAQLPAALAAAVQAAPGEDIAALVTRLTPKVGRVICNGWPTGVATTWAQQHGGPWPATTVASATSVGAAALQRFLRPVAFQDVPDDALPPALQSSNPWQLPRRIDGVLST